MKRAVVLTFATLLITGTILESSATETHNGEQIHGASTTERRNQLNDNVATASSTVKNRQEETENIPEPSPLLADSSGYRMPGLFDLNGGEPFYLEKDPVTGAVNFSVTSSGVKNNEDEDSSATSSLKNHKYSDQDHNEDDYYYDDEEVDDGIDRRDDTAFHRVHHPSSSKSYPPTINDVGTKEEGNSNYKQQTNYNKFPLISSSYANTKVQGTAGGNKNHRPYVTSSTQSPSYYTIRPQPTFRGTVKYSSSSSSSTEVPKKTYQTSLETTTHYKTTTEDNVKYNPQRITPPKSTQQQKIDNGQFIGSKPQESSEYDKYEEEEEEQYFEKTKKQPQQENINLHASNSEDSLYPTKTTKQPIEYEDSNEDYDTEPTGFSLSELFGYGKPTKAEVKKPHVEETKQQASQNQKPEQTSEDHEHENYGRPQPATTVQSVHLAPTTLHESVSNPEFTSEEQNLIPEKNHIENQLYTTVRTTSSRSPITTNSVSTIRTPSTTRIPPTTRKPTTQTPGIIYSEPNIVSTPNQGTHRPIHLHSTQHPQHISSSPPFGSDVYLHSSTETAIPDSVPIASDSISTVYKPNLNQNAKPPYFGGNFEISTVKNNPYGSYAEEPFRPIFGPGEIENRPLVRRPEQQSLVAPSIKDNVGGNTNTVSKPPLRDTVIIPQESPTRWLYPHNDGTSTFFQLQTNAGPNQKIASPPRSPESEIQRQRPQNPTFTNIPVNQSFKIGSQQKPDVSVPVKSAIPNATRPPAQVNNNPHYHQNLNVNLQVQDDAKPAWTDNTAQKKGDVGHVIFPDNHAEGAKPHVDALKRPITGAAISINKNTKPKEENQQVHQRPAPSRPDYQGFGQFETKPNSNQRRPPVPSHPASRPTNVSPLSQDIVEEPAQELRPPAEPEDLKKHALPGNQPRPPWESRPAFPQFPPSQTARPKLDTVPQVPLQQGQSSGNGPHTRPSFSHEGPYQGRPQQIPKNHNQDPNLPNILPQFRPNAKISHIHIENGGRIQAHTSYFGNQRQPLLERPSRRPPPEFMGHLHPPPPPHRRRVNRNDTPGAQDMFPFEKYPPQPPTVIQQRPLVHRRTGPHVPDDNESPPQIATLQMMQQHQHNGPSTHYLSRPLAARDDFPHSHEESKPPFHIKYPSGSLLDAEASEKRPVFLVYPENSNPGNSHSDHNNAILGTKSPQHPILSTNQDSESDLSLSSEDISTLPFPSHKNQKPLLQLPSDRLDSELQKPTSNNARRPIKTDFPYPLEKPDTFSDKTDKTQMNEDNEEKSSMFGSDIPSDRYDHNLPLTNDGIQAEIHNSNDGKNDSIEEEDDDTEINIIPYLQDYMPFATKKPLLTTKLTSEKILTTLSSNSISSVSSPDTVKLESNKPNQWISSSNNPSTTQEARIVHAGSSGNDVHSSTSSFLESHHSSSPISVTLKTIQPQFSTTHTPTASTPFKITDYPQSSPIASAISHTTKGTSLHTSHQQGLVGSGGSEFTVSAVMHTHPQALSNHRPPEGATSTIPPQLNFQAPFLASANIGGTPTNQGWSVVGKGGPSNERMKPGTVDKVDLDAEESEVSEARPDESGESPNFDFENFRPQLFGGFKPIYTFPEDNGEGSSKFLQTTERQEKMLK
ncbi:hypothetical protein C0J52_14764 [Blattella germanica]|nr:hypothetical protein C0J52_14764 [Blattella germanica]